MIVLLITLGAFAIGALAVGMANASLRPQRRR